MVWSRECAGVICGSHSLFPSSATCTFNMHIHAYTSTQTHALFSLPAGFCYFYCSTINKVMLLLEMFYFWTGECKQCSSLCVCDLHLSRAKVEKATKMHVVQVLLESASNRYVHVLSSYCFEWQSNRNETSDEALSINCTAWNKQASKQWIHTVSITIDGIDLDAQSGLLSSFQLICLNHIFLNVSKVKRWNATLKCNKTRESSLCKLMWVRAMTFV